MPRPRRHTTPTPPPSYAPRLANASVIPPEGLRGRKRAGESPGPSVREDRSESRAPFNFDLNAPVIVLGELNEDYRNHVSASEARNIAVAMVGYLRHGIHGRAHHLNVHGDDG